MNAGKTTSLLQYNYNCKEKYMNTCLFIPSIAKNESFIESRIGLKEPAVEITEELNIFKYVRKIKLKPNFILVDEAQFLKKKHVFELISIVDILKISVLTYGLRTNFKSKLFEGSKYLFALSDKIIEIKTLCKCGNKAIMNVKISKDNKKILFGTQIDVNKKVYISVCRYHFYKYHEL